jgi:hypothetical protein
MHPIFEEIRKECRQLLANSKTLHSFSFSVEYISFVKEERDEKRLHYLLVIDGIPVYYPPTEITTENNVSHRWEAEQVSEHVQRHLAGVTREQAHLLITEALRNFYETHRDFYRKEEEVISEKEWEKELVDATLELAKYRAQGLHWLSRRLRSTERTDLIMRYRHRRRLFEQLKRDSKESYIRAPRHYTRGDWAIKIWRVEAQRKYPHLYGRYPNIVFELGNDPGFTPKEAALESLSQDTSIPVSVLDRRIIRGARLKKKRTKEAQNQA